MLNTGLVYTIKCTRMRNTLILWMLCKLLLQICEIDLVSLTAQICSQPTETQWKFSVYWTQKIPKKYCSSKNMYFFYNGLSFLLPVNIFQMTRKAESPQNKRDIGGFHVLDLRHFNVHKTPQNFDKFTLKSKPVFRLSNISIIKV